MSAISVFDASSSGMHLDTAVPDIFLSFIHLGLDAFNDVFCWRVCGFAGSSSSSKISLVVELPPLSSNIFPFMMGYPVNEGEGDFDLGAYDIRENGSIFYTHTCCYFFSSLSVKYSMSIIVSKKIENT